MSTNIGSASSSYTSPMFIAEVPAPVVDQYRPDVSEYETKSLLAVQAIIKSPEMVDLLGDFGYDCPTCFESEQEALQFRSKLEELLEFVLSNFSKGIQEEILSRYDQHDIMSDPTLLKDVLLIAKDINLIVVWGSQFALLVSQESLSQSLKSIKTVTGFAVTLRELISKRFSVAGVFSKPGEHIGMNLTCVNGRWPTAFPLEWFDTFEKTSVYTDIVCCIPKKLEKYPDAFILMGRSEEKMPARERIASLSKGAYVVAASSNTYIPIAFRQAGLSEIKEVAGIDLTSRRRLRSFKKVQAEPLSQIVKSACVVDRLGCSYFVCGPMTQEEQFEYFKTAALDGVPAAMYLYSVALEKHGDIKESLDWGMKAVELGDLDAMNYIGKKILWKEGALPQDVQQGFELILKAAAKGHIDSMKTVASFYSYGSLGIEKDLEKAFSWNLLAAEKGDSGAMYQVGGWYHQKSLGEGLPAREELLALAKKWLEKAWRKGDHRAAFNLAQIGPINAEKALSLYREAARYVDNPKIRYFSKMSAVWIAYNYSKNWKVLDKEMETKLNTLKGKLEYTPEDEAFIEGEFSKLPPETCTVIVPPRPPSPASGPAPAASAPDRI